MTEALTGLEKERDQLRSELNQSELKHQLATQSMKERYEIQIHDRDQAIERLRDMKARLSTKMVRETLEQHCETEFNRIRAAAFAGPTSKKTTTPVPAAKAITSSETATTPTTRSSRSCSRW